MPRPKLSFDSLHAALTDADSISDGGAAPALPEKVRNFLGALRLLHGVPFTHLVPDEQMLPPESIRWFYVDPNWLLALLDGALVPGRANNSELAHARSIAGEILNAADEAADELRENDSEATRPASISEMSGFVLRSAVVAGWPGLEVEAFDATGQLLRALRIDRPGNELLLCIFRGEMQEVRIHEPSESLHSGFDQPDTGNPGPQDFFKQLKVLKNSATQQVGDPLTQTTLASIPFRQSRPDRRVLDIGALVAGLETKLLSADQLNAGEMDSAHFALQMLEGVGQVIFQRPEAG